jgi:drug/metabolite transporter (DMT)-like permease
VSDSGPNLGVRGVGFLLVLGGLLLMVTAYRVRKRTSRLSFSPTTAIYACGAFILGGAGAILFGAFLLGAGF